MGASCCQATKVLQLNDNQTAGLKDNFSQQQQRIFIIDAGSANTRCGYNLQDFQINEYPTIEIPTIVGKHKEKKDSHLIYGQEVNEQLEDLDISFLVEDRQFINQEQMLQFFKHLIKRGNAFKSSILFAEQLDPCEKQKSKLIEFLFETYNIPAICFMPTCTLSLIGAGLTTGFVIESGESRSWAVPIIESVPQRKRNSVTLQLAELLNLSEKLKSNKHLRFALQSIKEQICEVKINQQTSISTTSHILPDLTHLEIKDEKYQAPEILFGKKGIETIIQQSLEKNQNEFLELFKQNIVLAGGTTMIKGYKNRLEEELKKIYPQQNQIHILELNDRQNLAWKGAKILTTEMPNTYFLLDKWITKKEYEEQGVEILKQKFFDDKI